MLGSRLSLFNSSFVVFQSNFEQASSLILEKDARVFCLNFHRIVLNPKGYAKMTFSFRFLVLLKHVYYHIATHSRLRIHRG
jgi:hypothetical protein